MTVLSKRQQAIYEFIQKETLSKGYPPSVREIADAVGLSSPSTVHSHLNNLEKLGYIKRDPSKPRAIVICHHDNSEVQDTSLHSMATTPKHDFIELPLLGQVAAGSPILAEEHIEDSFKLPLNLVKDTNSFMLKVRGDSMIEVGIYSGDYLIVQECSTAHNGDIVVALIEDEATVKTFYREYNRIRLQPENQFMEPIYAENPHILGKVTGLFRAISS